MYMYNETALSHTRALVHVYFAACGQLQSSLTVLLRNSPQLAHAPVATCEVFFLTLRVHVLSYLWTLLYMYVQCTTNAYCTYRVGMGRGSVIPGRFNRRCRSVDSVDDWSQSSNGLHPHGRPRGRARKGRRGVDTRWCKHGLCGHRGAKE